MHTTEFNQTKECADWSEVQHLTLGVRESVGKQDNNLVERAITSQRKIKPINHAMNYNSTTCWEALSTVEG
jgi:hypothetical protein